MRPLSRRGRRGLGPRHGYLAREAGLAAVEGQVWRQPSRGAARKRLGGSVASRGPHAPVVFTAQGDLGPAAGDCRRRPDARCCGRPAGANPKGQVVAPARQAAQAAEGSGSRLTVAGPAVLVSFSFPYFFFPFISSCASSCARLCVVSFCFPFLFFPFIGSCACLFLFLYMCNNSIDLSLNANPIVGLPFSYRNAVRYT